MTVVKNNGHILRIFAEKKRIESAMVTVDQSLRMLFANSEQSCVNQLKVRVSALALIYDIRYHSFLGGKYIYMRKRVT